MWCSYEKLCKLIPEKIEVGKYFSEINPKILMFNNKFMMSANTNLQNQTNLNNTKTKNPLTSININQPKDFSLSPDNYNQNKNQNNNANKNILNFNMKNKADINNLHLSNLTNIENSISSLNQNNNQNQNFSNTNITNNIFYDKNNIIKNQGKINIPNPFNINQNNLNNLSNNHNGNNNNSNNNNNNINQNNFHNTFTTSNNSVSRFNVLGHKEDESDLQNSNPSLYNKYQPEFRVYTDNSEAEKQITTPVVIKDKIEQEYENLNNMRAFLPQKQNNLRPFTYSNSPNEIGQDLNKIICNSELMNNKYGNNNSSISGNNLNNSSSYQNNQNTNNNNELKIKFLEASNIKPFNFNTHSSINNTNQEFTPKERSITNESNNLQDYNLNLHEQNPISNNIASKNYPFANSFVVNSSNANNSITDSANNNLNNVLINNKNNNIFQNIQLAANENKDIIGKANNNINNGLILNNIANTNINLDSNTFNNNFNNNNAFNFSNYFIKNYSNNLNNTNKFTGNNYNANLNNSKYNNQTNIGNKSYETYYSIKRSEARSELGNISYNLNHGKFSDLSQLLKLFGEILKALSMYKCKEAISLIDQLPSNHKKSGLVLSLLGKAYFELAKFKDCEKYYRESLKVEPYRLEGVEYFSSCLWHLKDQYQLCNLANHVLEQSLFAPETWVVLGNSYSLQKEHEVALKFFTRAIQLNPSFAYAYTLCGHEHFSNESYVEARSFYSKALGIDEK